VKRIILSAIVVFAIFIPSVADAGPLQRIRNGERTPVVNVVRLIGKVPLPQIQIAKAIIKGIVNR